MNEYTLKRKHDDENIEPRNKNDKIDQSQPKRVKPSQKSSQKSKKIATKIQQNTIKHYFLPNMQNTLTEKNHITENNLDPPSGIQRKSKLQSSLSTLPVTNPAKNHDDSNGA